MTHSMMKQYFRISLNDVAPGEKITIRVQPKDIAVSWSVIPWELA